MKIHLAVFGAILLGAAVPADAQRGDVKAEGARFDAAVIAGHAQAYGIAGPMTVARATTVGCTTHLLSGKEDWTIDWTSASIDDESSASDLDVTMGRPDAVFVLHFVDRTKLSAARLAGRHLAAGCSG